MTLSKFIIFFTLLFGFNSALSSMPPDSIPPSKLEIKLKNYILPGSLILLGASYPSKLSKTNDLRIKNYSQMHLNSLKSNWDDLYWSPATFLIADDIIHPKSRIELFRKYSRVIATYSTSLAFIYTIKSSTMRLRPDASDKLSFASGHSAFVFSGAEMVNLELSKKQIAPKILSYGLATAIASLRVINNRHWFTDVLAGAGIGIGTARLIHWVEGRIYNKYDRSRV